MQNWIRDFSSPVPRALERRLFLSYLAAFALIFLIAAVAVRSVFVTIVREHTIARLYDVAHAGMRSVIFRGDTMAIDKSEVSNSSLLMPEQGLQWFDRGGHQLAAQGLTPGSGARANFYSVTAPILNPATHRSVGTVVASEWDEEERRNVEYLDLGLVVGSLLAVLGSAAAGLALAHRAVRPVERSFQSLREFTDNASHELRGPLAAIAASADAALRDTKRDPRHDRARFETIADGAKQMSRMAADLLLLAGAERSLERELFAVDLAAMVGRLFENYRRWFSAAGIGLEVGTLEPATVYGNPDQVERVLANLLENAFRYTPAGGQVRIDCRREGGAIVVAVDDSGVGISPENLERIFDRFWRADPVRSPKGSGLGLSIARALARRHGGDVTVTSCHGLGSKFVASFPSRPGVHLLRYRS